MIEVCGEMRYGDKFFLSRSVSIREKPIFDF